MEGTKKKMFQCKDLLSLPSLAKGRLIAGKLGLDRGIRWPYKAENMHFSQWVYGQELLIVSTPVIQSDEFDMYELVKRAVQSNLSGALLLVGDEYINKIEKRVIVYADTNHFPLFVLPWNVPLIDVHEELGHAIAYHDKMDMERQDLLAGIIFGNIHNEEQICLQAELLDYDMKGKQRVFLFHIESSKNVWNIESVEEKRKWLLEHISACFALQGQKVIISRFSNNLVGLTKVEDESHQKLLSIFSELEREIDEVFPDLQYYIGISNVHSCLHNLPKGFLEASKVIALFRESGMNHSVIWYDELGFYQILLQVGDTQMLKDYESSVLGKLEEYDEKNHTELIKTLEAYFRCNENIKATAEYLYSHPNTIKYRMRRIEEVADIDMGDSRKRFELYIALHMYVLNRT